MLVAPSANDVKALFEPLNKLWDVGGVMLQVSIHGDDKIAARSIEASTQSNGLARVVAQGNDGYPAVYLSDLLQEGETAVRASVVDKNALKSVAGRVQRFLEAPVERRDALPLIPQGNDHGISNKSQVFGHAHASLWVFETGV